MSGISLYDITSKGMEIEEYLRANDGELTPEFELWLDQFLEKGKDKIEGAAMVVRSLEESANACDKESDRLKSRSSDFKRQADGLRQRMLHAVDSAFSGKVKTDCFTIWGQTSGETVSFEVAPDADLPAIQRVYPEIVRAKYELDKIELKNRIKAGEPIPPAISVDIVPGKRFLRIK